MQNSAIRFYFSFRSPFAGIAVYRLRRLAMFNDFEIDLIPVWPEIVFGGHMDNPTDNLFKLAYVFADAARQAEDAGLNAGYLKAVGKNIAVPAGTDLKKQKVGLNLPTENWPLPHYAFLYAKSQGKGWAFADAVFQARFGLNGEAAKNVMDKDVLRDIAITLELNPDALIGAHESGEYDLELNRYIEQGEADGVFGVPFFVVDGNANQPEGKEVFWGNDHLPYLYKVLTDSAELPLILSKDLTSIQAHRQ